MVFSDNNFLCSLGLTKKLSVSGYRTDPIFDLPTNFFNFFFFLFLFFFLLYLFFFIFLGLPLLVEKSLYAF